MSKPVVNPAYYLTNTSTVASGGAGYQVNDVLTLAGGSFATSAQITVTSLFSGAVTGFIVSRPGSYNAGGLPNNPVPTTGGNGTGCTIKANWIAANPGFTNIQIYGTNTAGTTPVAGTLVNRELFVDTATPTLYVGNQLNQIVKLVGTLGGQDKNAVSITGGTITGLPSPSAASDAATRGYVDGKIANPKTLGPVQCANTTSSYNLAVVQPLPIFDSYQIQEGDRVLLTQQTAQVNSATIATGGTGYNVGDTITLVGATATTAPVFTVTAVTAGAVTGMACSNQGSGVTAYPTNPVSFTTTTGTGSGVTANLVTVVAGANNGLWNASALTLWTRTVDSFPAPTSLVSVSTLVLQGAANKGLTFVQTAPLTQSTYIEPQTWLASSSIQVALAPNTGLFYNANNQLSFVVPTTSTGQPAFLQSITDSSGTFATWQSTRGVSTASIQNATDLVNKNYVDSKTSGVTPVAASYATTGALVGWTFSPAANTWTSPVNQAFVIDGYTPVAADINNLRILVKDQGTQTISGATPVNQGTGFAVGNQLRVVGGTFTTAALVSVTAVSGTAVTALNVDSPGSYTQFPTNPVSFTPVGGTTGTGLTANLTFSTSAGAISNGVFVLTALSTSASTSTILTRTSDYQTQAQIVGSLIQIAQGAVNSGSAWLCTATAPFTLNTSVIPYSPYGGTSTTLTVPKGGTGTTNFPSTYVLIGNGQNPVVTSPNFRADITDDTFILGNPATYNGVDNVLYVNGGSRIAQAYEKCNIDAGALGANTTYGIGNGAVTYYTTALTQNFSFNFTGAVGATPRTLDSIMDVGHSVTVATLVTNGAMAFYCTGVQVDGAAPARIRWQGATAPSYGNANSLDSYIFTIIKTAAATFTVIASQTQFGG